MVGDNAPPHQPVRERGVGVHHTVPSLVELLTEQNEHLVQLPAALGSRAQAAQNGGPEAGVQNLVVVPTVRAWRMLLATSEGAVYLNQRG